MRLNVAERRLVSKAVDRGNNKSLVAHVFGITWKTVNKWCKRRKHLKDRKRKPKQGKITFKVEQSILSLRSLDFGTARIQQGLDSLLPYIKEALPNIVQGFKLSRTAINNVLKKHEINGYNKKAKWWKFFRAENPNELWQIDLKGPFALQGKKYWFIICIDDYSRYLLLNECLDHYPNTEEVFGLLKPLIKKHKPKNILADNGAQFRENWKKLCEDEKVKPLSTHPYYPQDKGKVERTIRNINEEFIHLLKKFPEWLGKIREYTKWFNEKRLHRGINTTPSTLYT